MCPIKHVIILVAFFCCQITSYGQQNLADSLIAVLRSAKLQDTTRITALNSLAWELKNNNPDTAMVLSKQALELSTVIINGAKISPITLAAQKGIAKSNHQLGVFNYLKGNYSLALDYYFKALKIRESLNDKKGISVTYSNIGVVYDNQGNYPQALNYYLKGLKIAEELGDKKSIATKLGNIGLLYYGQGDYPKALGYYFKTLKMAEELKDDYLIATYFGNIGNIYYAQGDYLKALDYYSNALKILEDLGDKIGIANNISNIGLVYFIQNDYPKALDYYFNTLRMATEQGNKKLTAVSLGNIGTVYAKIKKYKEAEGYLKKALVLSIEINALNLVKDNEQQLSELYTQTEQPAKALEHYKKYIEAKDSIFNEENTKKTVRSEMNFEFEKKQTEEKIVQNKKDIIAVEELKQQRLQRNYFIVGFALVLLLALFIYRGYREKQKANSIITLQKNEMEEQKKVVEEKNKDILDSIHYAKRIQDALLKEEEHVSAHLPEHFILFMPKDIVSGDFYWATEKQGYWYVAAVDCTGHGVPGAFMSMLGMSFLNDIVSDNLLLSPAEILDQLCEKVVNELRQTGEAGGSKDGMDISLIRINLKELESTPGSIQIHWAGANNALNIIQNGQLREIKADKQPIGYYPEQKPFTNHEITLQTGDSIYIFTDGYADQFGGPKGKKFKYKQLEELLLANTTLPMNQQKEMLKTAFVEWKGSLEQIDDVCVIGVKV
ncbi:MAG: tetratricopeptide repeat protein [Bacteroidota bacterium]